MMEGTRFKLHQPLYFHHDSRNLPKTRPSPPSTLSFRELLKQAAQAISFQEAQVERILSSPPRRLQPHEALLVQALVHRYTETVDLVSRITEKGVSAIRQVLNPQS
ncbi:MAG: hypothetical protein N2515_00565 [Deltaproteobacteria bacterium]|nr:hypothetical protein [Deltaproteobacteria bacterium]